MSIHLLEEISTPALDALDRDRTVVILTVSPLEEHGPHLPVGVDAMTARHLAESIAERVVAERPGWSAVLAPTLHLGSFTFETVGTINIRQRVVRDVVVDYGAALARSGFRYVLIANGHAGPGHLVALEEAAAIVSRRHRITMASLTGHLAWEFLRGRMLPRIEAALGGALSADERRAFAEDAHGGWWETSVMLMLRPDLVRSRLSLARARALFAGPAARPQLRGAKRRRRATSGIPPSPTRASPRPPPACSSTRSCASSTTCSTGASGRRSGARRSTASPSSAPTSARPGRHHRRRARHRLAQASMNTREDTTMKAYVLIETAAGKTKNVKKALLKIKSGRATVAAMDAVTGPYDFIAVVEGNSLDAIGNLVTESIGVVDGVTRTTTCVAVSIG